MQHVGVKKNERKKRATSSKLDRLDLRAICVKVGCRSAREGVKVLLICTMNLPCLLDTVA